MEMPIGHCSLLQQVLDDLRQASNPLTTLLAGRAGIEVAHSKKRIFDERGPRVFKLFRPISTKSRQVNPSTDHKHKTAGYEQD